MHESGNYWIAKIGKGHFEVYKNGVTHATRCDIIHYSDDEPKALARAILLCERRAAETN